MRIVQITPGAGGMYCGNCFRDNMLVREWRRQGHDVLMIPLYLPMTLDEADESSGTPVFFGGINVYLQQQLKLFGHMPDWLHRQLASPALLKWASGKAAKTRAEDLGALTLSMIKGEEGNQVRELRELVAYLKEHHRPDVICLSNALLAGLARTLKKELGAPIVCMLQGEDSFLDTLPESHREKTWAALGERGRELDLFIAPTRYFGERMGRRLGLPAEKVKVVYNGIDLEGYAPAAQTPSPPVLGYFARMCREKGLDLLVESYIQIRKNGLIPGLRLHVGGGMGPADEPFVAQLKVRLQGEGLLGDVTFFPNVSKEQKQEFYKRLTVMSVPAMYGEAFGLYLVESWASGVPTVQPPVASFPELAEASGAGVIAAGSSVAELAGAIEELLLNEGRRTEMSLRARQAVQERFSVESMARAMASHLEEVAVPPVLASAGAGAPK